MLTGAALLTSVESGLLYAALGVFGGATFVGIRVVGGRRRGRALRPMLAIGTVLITVLLVLMFLREGHSPLASRFATPVLAAWALGLGALAVSRRLARPILAAVAAPTLALLVFLSVLMVPFSEASTSALRLGIASHIVFGILGFAGFSASAGIGVLYLRQIRVMKRDPTAAVAGRMPALEKLDRLNFVAAAVGFPFLVLSVLAGWLFIAVNYDSAARWWLDPTVLATLGGLAVYTLLFFARGFLGWYGRRIALLSVIGFVLAVIGFAVAAFCTSPSVLHS